MYVCSSFIIGTIASVAFGPRASEKMPRPGQNCAVRRGRLRSQALTSKFRVELAADQIDIGGSLELFRRSGDDFIDRWDGQQLLRAVYTNAHTWIPFVARSVGGGRVAAFEVVVEDEAHADRVKAVVANTFMPAPADYQRLLAEDPAVAGLDKHFPGIRQIRQLDVFTALVRCISAQQVNLRWAVITRRRMAEAFGQRYDVEGQRVYALDPELIATVDPAEIRALQF